MRPWLAIPIMAVLTALLAFAIGFIFLQSEHNQASLLFFPSKVPAVRPAWLENSCAEKFIPVEKGYLHAWHIHLHGHDEHSPVILFLHGNSGNMQSSAATIHFLAAQILPVFAIDYGGFGQSCPGTKPTAHSVMADGLAAYDYLTQTMGKRRVIPYGFSMGGAVASNIARSRTCDALVMHSTFSNLIECLGSHAILKPVVKYALPQAVAALQNNEHLRSVSCPVLVVHDVNDETIPVECAHSNFAAIAHDRKKLILQEGKGHLYPELTEIFATQFKDFLVENGSLPTSKTYVR